MRSLGDVSTDFYRKSEALLTIFVADPASTPETKKYCAIRLLDLWSSFSRNIIVRSAVGNCVTVGGLNLPKGSYANFDQVVNFCRMNSKGKIGPEPRWHDASIAASLAKKLDVANRITIASSLGSLNSPANSLRLIRNHFAHEGSKDCWEKFSSETWPNGSDTMRPLDFLNATTAGGITRFKSWVRELQAIASASAH